MTSKRVYKMGSEYYLGQFDEDNKLIGSSKRGYAKKTLAEKKLANW